MRDLKNRGLNEPKQGGRQSRPRLALSSPHPQLLTIAPEGARYSTGDVAAGRREPVPIPSQVARRRSAEAQATERGGPRGLPFEVTEHDPPRKLSFRGTTGPVRPVATLTVEPVGDESRSRVSLQLDLQGHGFGKLVAPIARRGAAKEVEQDHARLKARLEAGI
ncbi:MAG: SRPBCC family protein [Solirubrobacteraceae bacterium]